MRQPVGAAPRGGLGRFPARWPCNIGSVGENFRFGIAVAIAEDIKVPAGIADGRPGTGLFAARLVRVGIIIARRLVLVHLSNCLTAGDAGNCIGLLTGAIRKRPAARSVPAAARKTQLANKPNKQKKKR